MRDILVKILDAIIALQPDDSESAETSEEPEVPVVEPAESNVADTRSTKRSVKK